MGADTALLTLSSPRAETVHASRIERLPDQKLGIATVAPFVQSSTNLRVHDKDTSVALVGATHTLFDVARLSLSSGRGISALDRTRQFAVLGADIAAQTGIGTGDTVEVSNSKHVVIGILSATPQNALLGLDFNRSILVPLETASTFTAVKPTTVALKLAGGWNARTIDHVAFYLGSRPGDGSVRIDTAEQLVETVRSQTQLYDQLVLGTGVVSMLLSGLGIANVLLMSVQQRRQEIGLRLAVGARRKDVRMIFFTESLALAVTGSALGVGFGSLGAWIYVSFCGWPHVIAFEAIVWGVSGAIIVGLLSGIVPAEKAARLDPILALRSE